MAKNKKITLNDIIARKQQGKLDKLQVKKHYCSELSGDIEIRKIPLKEILELLEKIQQDDIDTIETTRLNSELVYKCCPIINQNSKELMNVYEVKDPFSLPLAILNDNLGEMNKILNSILAFYGLDEEEKIDDTIKN
ncbi:hypothetical protein AN1V17_11820 [Vallitalea sediminicola]